MSDQERKDLEKNDAIMNRIKEIEESDKKSEDQKKKLRRKVIIRNSVITILIVIIIILLLRGCTTDGKDSKVRFGALVQDGVTETEEGGSDSLYVTMPIIDNFTVSSKQPEIVLYSPEENEGNFYIYYTFTDENGNVIYKSDAVEAGTRFKVNFKELLDVGQHKVKASISAKFIDTMEDANGTTTDITVSVLK